MAGHASSGGPRDARNSIAGKSLGTVDMHAIFSVVHLWLHPVFHANPQSAPCPAPLQPQLQIELHDPVLVLEVEEVGPGGVIAPPGMAWGGDMPAAWPGGVGDLSHLLGQPLGGPWVDPGMVVSAYEGAGGVRGEEDAWGEGQGQQGGWPINGVLPSLPIPMLGHMGQLPGSAPTVRMPVARGGRSGSPPLPHVSGMRALPPPPTLLDGGVPYILRDGGKRPLVFSHHGLATPLAVVSESRASLWG